MNTETFITKTAARIYDIAAPEKLDRGIHYGHLQEDFRRDLCTLMDSTFPDSSTNSEGYFTFDWNGLDLRVHRLFSSKKDDDRGSAYFEVPEGASSAFALMELTRTLIMPRGEFLLNPNRTKVLTELLKQNTFCLGAYELVKQAMEIKQVYRTARVNHLKAFTSGAWGRLDLESLRSLTSDSSPADVASFAQLNTREQLEALILLKASPERSTLSPLLYDAAPAALKALCTSPQELEALIDYLASSFEFSTFAKAKETLSACVDSSLRLLKDPISWIDETPLFSKKSRSMGNVSAVSPMEVVIKKQLLSKYPFDETLSSGSLAERCAWLLHKQNAGLAPMPEDLKKVFLALPKSLQFFLLLGSTSTYFNALLLDS